MIVEYVRYQIPPEERTAFEGGYRGARQALDASPFCLGYELSRCVEDPGSYVLRIEWTSAEDHRSGFRGGPDFPSFLRAVRPFVPHIQEMRHYERTPVVSAVGTEPKR